MGRTFVRAPRCASAYMVAAVTTARTASRVGSPPASLAAHHRGRVWEPFQGSHVSAMGGAPRGTTSDTPACGCAARRARGVCRWRSRPLSARLPSAPRRSRWGCKPFPGRSGARTHRPRSTGTASRRCAGTPPCARGCGADATYPVRREAHRACARPARIDRGALTRGRVGAPAR